MSRPASEDAAELDRPEVIAEVLAAFHRYEHALVTGDVDTLTALFWDDPRCLRYGVADRQRGADAIAAWRRAHPSASPGRRLRETEILALSGGTAVVNTLFDYPGGRTNSGSRIEGRQSQVWVRFLEGWRIVAAHVSEVPADGRST
ncbi:MAG: AtzH-like domain-containing protein [Pseudonocardia sp.]